MRGGGRVGDERLRVSEVVGDVDQVELVERGIGRLQSALHRDGQHGAAAFGHLRRMDVVMRVVAAAGIANGGDLFVGSEAVCDRTSVVAHAADAQVHRFEAFQHHPRIERREGGASVAVVLLEIVLDLFRLAEDRAAKRAALAVHVLGRRIDDPVSAERERFLQDGRGEDVVDDEFAAGGVGEVSHGADIDRVEQRVGRRLDDGEAAGLRHGPFPVAEIGAIDPGHVDAHLGHDVLEDPDDGREQLARGNDAVAGLHRRDQHGVDRGHARRCGAAVFGAFELGEAFLEHADSRVGVARVDVAGLVASHAGRLLFRAVIYKSRIEIERFGGLAVLRACGSAADHQGLRAPGFGFSGFCFFGHGGCLSLTRPPYRT